MAKELRILIVEDSEDDAFFMVREVSRGGYYVISERVENAVDMKSLLESKTWDVIISDYNLPKFSAPEALKLIKALRIDLPFIIISGVVGEEIAVKAMKAGAHDFIMKGNLTRLVPAIERELKEAEDRRERINAEQQLRNSEERYRAVIELSPDGIFIYNAEAIVFANSASAVLVGLNRPEDIVRSSIYDFVHPESRRIITDTFNDVLLLNKKIFFRDLKLLKEAGPIVFVDGAAVPFNYMGEKAILLEARDITERKSMEEALMKARDELELRVKQRTNELEISNEQLRQEINERHRIEAALERQAQELIESNSKLEKVNQELERSNRELELFAYVASHDLQEPLRMVASYVQLLARRYKGKFDTDADEFINYAVDGATRMQQMINDLLLYSRVETQGKELAPVDCELVFNRTISDLQLKIDETKAVVTSDPLPLVVGDEFQLGQLFQNLIGNAIKFHGIEPPRVHISAERKGTEWLFSVKDNGIGLDQKYSERIFVVFQRLHFRDEYQGTGIGLAVCKKIVERHGGRIWVESTPGKGSVFYFTLKAI
ncbi:MAG: hypothetical protein A2X42_07015 [Candidatus Margulisbacteria bacterium GWF2_38_17]|nr:MAG: hypothetical protein A2X42_07015 [Candidatus Margulisbacteria bacterium GWF2_38_17]OGI11353.1 MAG: hypothetical protein A2X41_07935 [Candidatus Margulisbacteria bacterium GWE2_39_32]